MLITWVIIDGRGTVQKQFSLSEPSPLTFLYNVTDYLRRANEWMFSRDGVVQYDWMGYWLRPPTWVVLPVFIATSLH